MSVEPAIARNAAKTLMKYLEEAYICESCKGDRMIGCKSCDAIATVELLQAWVNDIEDTWPEAFA